MNEPSGVDPYEPPRSLDRDAPAPAPRSAGALPWTPVESVSFAWATIKKRPGSAAMMFVATLVASLPQMIGSGIFNALMMQNEEELQILGAVAYALGILIGIPLMVWIQMGVASTALELARGRVPDHGLVFRGGPFLNGLGTILLVGLATVVGMLLCVVPGVIVALGWLLWIYVVVEHRVGPIETLRRAWRLTDGHKVQIFVFLLLYMCLGLAAVVVGLLALCVGVLVTYPAVIAMLSISQAWVYLKLSGEEPKLVA